MNKIKIFLEVCRADGAIAGWITLLVSVGLLIASFIVPPTGVIDSSVLRGVGELFAFATLFKLPNIIQSISDGKQVTLQHGSTTVTVGSRDEEGEEEKGDN